LYQSRTIGVVVPAYNEELFIEEVVRTMPSFVDRIFVVNDGSMDGTGRVLGNMKDSKLRVITHKNRSGAGAAMLTGYKRACQEKMDVTAIMAGDGQMDPALLKNILEPVLSGKAEYSKGNRLSSRRNRTGMPRWRLLGNSAMTYVVKIASGYWRIADPLNGYTAISREALENLDLDHIEKDYTFEADLLVKLNALNARVVNVPMPSRYRNEKSKIVYLNFALRTGRVLVRDFFWRLWTKYIKYNLMRYPKRRIAW
jgi:glycosyltransferase involved in cell wall biosynthesis